MLETLNRDGEGSFLGCIFSESKNERFKFGDIYLTEIHTWQSCTLMLQTIGAVDGVFCTVSTRYETEECHRTETAAEKKSGKSCLWGIKIKSLCAVPFQVSRR